MPAVITSSFLLLRRIGFSDPLFIINHNHWSYISALHGRDSFPFPAAIGGL
jgi:hypothetical protein